MRRLERSVPAAYHQAATAALKWLEAHQQLNGSIELKGTAPTVSENAWAALALAAAGINAQDQSQPAGATLAGWLERAAPGVTNTIDLSLLLLVAHADGINPHSFGGVDLVGTLINAQTSSGGFATTTRDTVSASGVTASTGSGSSSSPDVPSTAYAALGLAAIPEPAAQSCAQLGVAWLATQQSNDGTWTGDGTTADDPAPAGTAETTAVVLEAMAATGYPDSFAESRGVTALDRLQNTDGGLSAGSPGGPSETRSSAAAVMALITQGIDPSEFANSSSGLNPLSFLLSAAAPSWDGAVGANASELGNDPVLTTSYALIALTETSPPFGPIAEPAPTVPGPPSNLPTGPLLPTGTPANSTPPTSTPPGTGSQPTVPGISTSGHGSGPSSAGITQVHGTGGGDHGTGGNGQGGNGHGGNGTGDATGQQGAGNDSGTGAQGSEAAQTATSTPVSARSGASAALHKGGVHSGSASNAPRQVSGNLLGPASATSGGAPPAAAIGTPGLGGGNSDVAWWAIALGVALGLALMTGLFIDRRSRRRHR